MSLYKQAHIYYFSGTGNSRRVALWIKEQATGMKSHVVNIGESPRNYSITFHDGSIVGIVFPTHGFTAPWKIIKFSVSLPRAGGASAFVVATRGGVRIRSFFLPGFAGTAYYLIALLLKIKGYNIAGFTGIDMPSNWVSLHSGLSHAKVSAIIARAEPKSKLFIRKIFSGKTHLVGIFNVIELLFGIVLLPVSLGYLAIGHFMLAKLFYPSASCNGCGLCSKQCPVGAIRMIGKKKPRPYWTFTCESCMRCISYCPLKAVEVSYPIAVAFCFIGSSTMLALLLNMITPYMPWLNNQYLRLPLEYLYALFSMFVCYLIFYFLVRNRFLNRLFTAITPVHYYRRYHEPNTNVRDFNNQKIH